MPSRVKSFRTNAQVASMFQPYITPPEWIGQGAFFGYEMRTHRAMFIDIRMLKRRGLIDSPVVVLYGKKNQGKTTLVKSLVARLAALQSGRHPKTGELRLVKARISDRKRENGEGEYAALTRFMMATPINLGTIGAINIFDLKMGMSEVDIVSTAINVAEDVLERPLVRYEPLAIQVAVYRMMSHVPHLCSPQTLEMLLRTPTHETLGDYFRGADKAFREEIDRKIQADPDSQQTIQKEFALLPTSDQAGLMEMPELFRLFCEDSSTMSACFGVLLRATYGGMFGSERSLYDLLTERITHLDWSEVSGKAGDLLEAMMYKWQRIAMERNLTEINADVVAGDEEGSAIKRLVHARYKDEYVRKARAYEHVDINVTQYSTDYNQLGDEGSELRQLGTDIRKGFGMSFYSAQPPDDDVLHSMTSNGISDEDAYKTTLLPRGCWGIHIPGQKMQFAQHLLLPSEIPLAESNRANVRVTNTERVSDIPMIQERVTTLEEIRARKAEVGTTNVGVEN